MSGNDLHELDVVYHTETDLAYLVSEEGDDDRRVWLAKSKTEVTRGRLLPGEVITIEIPRVAGRGEGVDMMWLQHNDPVFLEDGDEWRRDPVQNKESQRSDPRLAGEVKRYHTWPTTGQENCATHQWNVARILLAIWPEAPRHLILEALFHDVGELATGDLPFPVKSENPTLGDYCRIVERKCRESMSHWGIPAEATLFTDDHVMLKVADYLDMWEFGLLETEKGNHHAEAIVSRTADKVSSLIPLTNKEFTCGILHYIEKRNQQHKSIMRDKRYD